MAALVRHIISTFSRRWHISVNDIQLLVNTWSRKGPSPAFAIAACPSVMPNQHGNSSPESPLDSIFNGILLAVPKFRKSLEKRLFRKHTYTAYMENAMPKKNVVPCLECGHFKEKGRLCANCYKKVQTETKEMQAKMGEDLEFNTPRTEVEFVYDDEKGSDNKFLVNMKKPRPSWFSKNLLIKTGS